MADLRKLLDIVNESSTTAGSVATFAAGLSGTHKRVEEDKPEAPSVLEYGNWENSALTTSSKLKKERKKAARVVKSIYGEDSVEEAANSKQQAAIAIAKKKEVGESKVVNRKTILEYASTPIRSKKDYLAKRKALQDLQISGTTADKKLIMQKRAELERQAKQLGFVLGEDGVAEGSGQNLSVQQLATISDEALDKVYGYGRSSPGNTFGWQANLMSAAYAKKMIDAGVTDIEKISDAIHKGWNVTAQKFVQNPDQFDDTEKLRQAGKLEAKLQQRAKLMKINYAQLDNEEQEKDRVVARALLQAIKGQQGVAEGSEDRKTAPGWHSDSVKNPNFNDELSGRRVSPPGQRLKSGKLSADERGSQERTKALMKFKQAQGGLTGPKGVLPEQGVAEGSLASRYSDDPTHPSFSAGAGPQKDPADSLQGILALRKSDPARAFRALQDYGFRNPKDPIIDAASKAGSAVKRQMLQKMGITDPRPGETPKEVIQAMHSAMFDYIEKNLPTQQGVGEGLLGTALDKAKSVGKKVLDVVAPDDEELLRQLQRSMGIPASSQHGKKSMAEPVDGKLDEADLIINPASMSKRPIGLLNKPQHPDHEVGMAKSDLYQASKNALAVFQMIRDVPEEVGIEGWVQEKIIKANDYLNTVREYLEGKQLESMDGVAPSTKMFTSEDSVEEGKTGPGLWANIRKRRASGKRMRKPGEEGAPSDEALKSAREGSTNESSEPVKSKCPECGGLAYDNKLLAEEKDACYNKVKSRYKVWPSAYASGALVKCRKVGAKNWGKGSK